jgi:hypothetical protein
MKRRLPPYNIPSVVKLKELISHNLDIIGFEQTELRAGRLEDFMELLAELLPERIPRDTLNASCEYLLGQVLTEDMLQELAWRLAGNLKRLRQGLLVLPWSGITEPEWMPVQVVQVDFDVTRRGHPGGLFTLQFLAGQACPSEIQVTWPRSYCHVLAPRMGFTKFARSKHPFRDVSEFNNLRFLVLVQPGEAEIKFEEIGVPGSAKAWNQRYIKMRARTLKGFKCPRKLPQDKPCFRCYFGQDRCGAAVRPATLIKLLCPQCDFVKYFDPEQPEVCIECYQVNIREEKKR